MVDSYSPFNGDYIDSNGEIKNILELGNAPADSPKNTMAPFNGAFYASDGSVHYIDELGFGKGGSGTNGWSPRLAVIADNERRVLRIADWTGGSGVKPAAGMYIGSSGFTADISEAVDIRGAAGSSDIVFATDEDIDNLFN